MNEYKIIGVDLAKTKLHLAAMNDAREVVLKKAITRDEFLMTLDTTFKTPQTFAFEACAGSHYMAQRLTALGHKVIVLKAKDVHVYAKSKQKNDTNDAIAICKAALDPELKHVTHKSLEAQRLSFFHKCREATISQRVQLTNALITSLLEFGYVYKGGKATFSKQCHNIINNSFNQGCIDESIHQAMIGDADSITHLLNKEKEWDKKISMLNKACPKARMLLEIPGIGPINASIFSIKPVETYQEAKDFAASLGLVPRQHTTGGVLKYSGITKQGDRYARKMLIQAARTIVMRTYKDNPPAHALYTFAQKLRDAGKGFNVTSVAVANKLARIIHAVLTKHTPYRVI